MVDKPKFPFQSTTLLNHVLENPSLFIPEKCLSSHILKKTLSRLCEGFQSTLEPRVLKFCTPCLPEACGQALHGVKRREVDRGKHSGSPWMAASGLQAPLSHLSLPSGRCRWPSASVCAAGTDPLAPAQGG